MSTFNRTAVRVGARTGVRPSAKQSVDFTVRDKVYLYSIRKDKKFQIFARLDSKDADIRHKKPIAEVGPVFVLDNWCAFGQMLLKLSAQKAFGTLLFVVNSGDKFLKLQAFVFVKDYDSLKSKAVPIEDILWKDIEENVSLRGMVIGGIDVIRKKALRLYRQERGSESEGPKSPKSKKKKSDNKESAQLTRYEKTIAPYRIRQDGYKRPRRNIALRLVHIPKVIEDWDNCLEIRTDYILPNKEEMLPFEGKVIGLYIPKGVQCILINRVVDTGKYDPERKIRQDLEKRKLHPILLLEKSFLWIEGILELNPSQDLEICYQPLDNPILKQLVIENYITGETDGVEYQHDLYGKVLFLNPTTNNKVNWSIEVSPLVYPTYKRRVLYINIPSDGKIEIKGWDKAFEEIIKDSNTHTNTEISNQSNENQIKNIETIPFKRWIERDFKPKIYEFLDICIESNILIAIPNNYRRNALRTREEILSKSLNCVKRYANIFFLYEHCHEKDKYWFHIKYHNFYLTHYGLMKMYKSKIVTFETKFKHHFYEQFV